MKIRALLAFGLALTLAGGLPVAATRAADAPAKA